MISIDTLDGSFNFRTVGVAIHNEQVLLHRATHDTWWSLPGGRVELHETSADALVREMREEMGVDVVLQRLLWVHEQFYVDDISLRRNHSLGFYYLMKVPESLLHPQISSFSSHEANDEELVFQWHPIAELETLAMPLYPIMLRTGLRNLPESVVHLVSTQ
ncbi:MAG: NUDIX hydrolase [Ktedonobacterales bacterium]|nr:NUDIX hydrolase [Ktedonobacterales bacterium]